MALDGNGNYMKNIGNRLPISEVLYDSEYSQFLEYCRLYHISFIDELKPYDYVAYRILYKVDAEFARIIRSKIDAIKSDLPVPDSSPSSTDSPVATLNDQDVVSTPISDESPKFSWKEMVQFAADAHMNTLLDDLEIPTRIRHRLMSIGVTTIGKMLLMKPEELHSIDFLGKYSIDIILAVSENLVKEYNYQFGRISDHSLNSGKVDEPAPNTKEEAPISIEKQSNDHQFIENSINKDVIAFVAQNYIDIDLDTMQLSIRTRHRLEYAGLNTVGKVFLATDEQLLSIKHFGNLSLQEIQDAKSRFLENYCYQQEELNNISVKIERDNKSTESGYLKRLSSQFRLYIEDVLLKELEQENEFSFTFPESQIIKKVKESIEVLGLDLFTQLYKDPEQTQSLIQVLQTLNHQQKIQNDLIELFTAIPESRREKKLRPFIKLFSRTYKTIEEELLQAFIGSETINDIQTQISSFTEDRIYKTIKHFLEWLSTDILDFIESVIADIAKTDREREVLTRRAHGDTLESISEILGVTRERIRQIEVKVFRNLKTQKLFSIILFAVSAELNGEIIIAYDDLQKVIPEPEILWYLLKKQLSGEFVFDKNINCFYMPSEVDVNSVYDLISNLPEHITESKREILLTDIEKNNNIPRKYLELAFEKYYQQTGNIWHTGKMSRGYMYSFVIDKYFPNGIRIYDMGEIVRFKKYLQEEFGDIGFSESDHAIWGIIQRTCVLYDRGVYIHPSKVPISTELVTRIEKYFIKSGRTSMTYHELFDKFADELLKQANITNRYALQGALRDLWCEKYECYRDGISTKEGYKITQEIEAYIRKNSPVSKEMLKSAFSGITDAMLMQNIARLPSVILTENSTFIHSKRLKFTADDYSIIKIIRENTNVCPITASKLLGILYSTHSDFLFRNNISTPNTLFGILQFMFWNEFSFSRPYISSLNTDSVSKREIILSLLEERDSIDIADLVILCEENHISYQSPSLLIRSLNNDFFRIDENTLVSNTCFFITDTKIYQIKCLLADAIGSKDYLILNAIDNFIFYPDLGYPWTHYLLRSILDKYLADDFKIIDNPTSRNVSSSFIIDVRLGIDNYEDLIRTVIRTEHLRQSFKDIENVLLWLAKEGFLAEKAVSLKNGSDLFNSTSIQLEKRNIPKFIIDRSYIYVDEYGKLCIL